MSARGIPGTYLWVSVVLPCSGDRRRWARSLASVQAQTYRHFEILVPDLGPADADLKEWIDRTGDARVRWIATRGTDGCDTGVAHASGKYICCLTPGDELDLTYIEKCLFHLQVNSLDLCASWELRSSGPRRTGPFSLALLRTADVAAAAAVMRTGRVRSIFMPDPSVPSRCRAWDLWLQMAVSGARGLVLPEALVRPFEDAPEPGAANDWLPRKYAGTGDRLDPTEIADADRAEALDLAGYAEMIGQPVDIPSRIPVLLAMPFLTMGGAEAVVSQLCRQLSSLGFSFYVITTGQAEGNQGDTSSWFAEHAAGIYHMPRFLDTPAWRAYVFYLIRQHSIALVWQVGSSFLYSLLPDIRRLFPGIAVVDLLFNPVGHAADHLKCRRAIDQVVTEYEGMKGWLTEHGVPAEHVSVIPNGVDLRRFAPQPRRDWRTGAPRAVGSPFVVGFFGRLSEEKAPDTFVEIAARFQDRAGFEFLLCGTGLMETRLRALCQRHGLGGRVHFLGFVSTTDYLPCCDVTVVCSRLDGRPNIVMESLAMGIPVVASRVGGIPAMAPDGQGSRLCEAENVEEFARAIEELASGQARYAQLAAAARSHAEAHFSLSGSGHRYAALFHRMIKQREALSRPVRARDLLAASGLKGGPRRKAPSLRPASWLRFWLDLLSPANARGNIQTIWLYRQVLGHAEMAGELSTCFDAGYYSQRYADAASSGIPLLWHYLICGFRERRNPSPSFDTRHYLATNDDVARAGINPLLHYIRHGRAEGRTGQP